MQVRRLGWLGIRTGRFEETVGFLEGALGLRLELRQPGRALFLLPNGDPIDVFDESDERYGHFTTGPVVGFVVDDVAGAREELVATGTWVGPVQQGEGFAWAHFRGPDGNFYELQGRASPER
jgi:catechol 2,3-dioxygenase-like lactoylglutathione lyase family enzyme